MRCDESWIVLTDLDLQLHSGHRSEWHSRVVSKKRIEVAEAFKLGASNRIDMKTVQIWMPAPADHHYVPILGQKYVSDALADMLWSLPIPRLIECLQEEGLSQELIEKAMN
jgi:hypothetical protein